MAKPRVITRAMRLLEEADKVKISADGRISLLGHVAQPPPWGLYAIIPLTDVDAMVSALARADAREDRLEPHLRTRRNAAAKRKTIR